MTADGDPVAGAPSPDPLTALAAVITDADRATLVAILRRVADECDTIRQGSEIGVFRPSAETWMRHRADQIERGEVPDGW
jgi:hypothetical protein